MIRRTGVAVALLAIAAPSARASTQLGQSGSSGGPCQAGSSYVQYAEGTGAPKYQAPVRSVITSWSHQAGSDATAKIQLKVLKRLPSDPRDYSASAQSAVKPLTPSSLNQFTDRIPMQAGETLGLYDSEGIADCYLPSTGSEVMTTSGSPVPGGIGYRFNDMSAFGVDKRLNLQATIEPDADGDGFGDETQDNCVKFANPGQQDANGNGVGDACEAAPPGGGGPGPGGGLPRDVTAPKLDLLTLSTRRFRAANLGGSIAVRVGTRVGYALSEAASVRFTVERAGAGRRVGRRCVARTRANRARPRCTRWLALRGGFTHRGSPGVNRFLFTGRLAGSALRAGSYRLVAQAVDAAGNRGRAIRLTFTIVS